MSTGENVGRGVPGGDDWALDDLAGTHVRLRAPRVEDLDAFHAGRDSDGERRWGQTELPRTLEASRRWLDELLTKPRDGDRAFLAIENTAATVVGSISVDETNRRLGIFSYGIGLFAPYRRRGYGTEAIVLMLRFYFDELGYQRCETGINAFNQPSLALHEKLGFTVEGVRRRAFYTQGRYGDVVMVSILDDEFRERHGLSASS